MKHVVTMIESPSSASWTCSCGQSSGPWTPSVAAQQAKRHTDEWNAYEQTVPPITKTVSLHGGFVQPKYSVGDKIELVMENGKILPWIVVGVSPDNTLTLEADRG